MRKKIERNWKEKYDNLRHPKIGDNAIEAVCLSCGYVRVLFRSENLLAFTFLRQEDKMPKKEEAEYLARKFKEKVYSYLQEQPK